MQRLLFILGYFYFVLLSVTGQAQTDTLDLDFVEVVASPLRQKNPGSQVQQWSKEELIQSGTQHIGELLQTQTGAFVKSYGLGSLATSSLRGGSAGHTLVLWNGIPVNSPMLGLLDLALLPTSFVDQMQLNYGGNTAQWGSGAIGGVLSLENTADFQQGFSVDLSSQIGSFDHFQQNLNFEIGKGNWYSTTRLLYLQAENDFSFQPSSSLPRERQTNAALEQKGLQQSIYLNLPRKQSLAAHFWLQASERQIPPTITQNESRAYQEDQAIRLVLHYKNLQSRNKTHARLGFVQEQIDFYDDINLTAAPSHFNSLIADFTHQFTFKNNHHLLLGSTHTFTSAEANGYPQGQEEIRNALFVSHQWQLPKWTFHSSLRQTLVDGSFVPFLPVVAVEVRPFNWLTLKSKVSRNYRLPTLNDRYWQPGGNPELTAEQGWSTEGTLQSQWQGQGINWRYAITGFHRKIKDWILWSRQDGQAFWGAYNITEVWSRGIEQRVEANYLTKKMDIRLRLGYDFIRSTNQVNLSFPRIASGSQLWYTPEHQFRSQLSLRWESIRLQYQHQWTGAYAGTLGPLASFQTSNARLQYDWKENKLSGSLFFQVYNLWNEEYQVIERRPMPGRHYRVGVNFRWQN